jgi:hypothetical protein
VKVTLATDKSGTYTAPYLLPGTYSISGSAAGFGTYVHDGIKLLTGEKVEIDLTLAVGSQTQEVRVTADAPLVETASATSGQVLTSQEIEDLPDNGRSPLGLAKSMEGVVAKQKNSVVQSRPFDNSAASDYSLGGGNSQSNEYLLNGVPNMQNSSRLPGYSPLQDSVQEVRVDLFESDASYGDTSGGTVNLVTKAGTNQFHGSVNEFNQFSAINAPVRWFASAAPQLATRQNQYGGVIGGPVWIPKVWDGRNKLFFLYSFEGFKGSTPAPSTTTVPTAAERTGDFSHYWQLERPLPRPDARSGRTPTLRPITTTSYLIPPPPYPTRTALARYCVRLWQTTRSPRSIRSLRLICSTIRCRTRRARSMAPTTSSRTFPPPTTTPRRPAVSTTASTTATKSSLKPTAASTSRRRAISSRTSPPARHHIRSIRADCWTIFTRLRRPRPWTPASA